MFDLLLQQDPESLVAASKQASSLLGQLDDAGSIDATNGEIIVDDERVRTALTNFFPKKLVNEFTTNGLQLLKSEGSAKSTVGAKDEASQDIFIPWAALRALASDALLLPSTLGQLGIKAGMDAEEVATVIKREQPTTPGSLAWGYTPVALSVNASVAEAEHQARQVTQEMLRRAAERAAESLRREEAEAASAAERMRAAAEARRQIETQRQTASAIDCLMQAE